MRTLHERRDRWDIAYVKAQADVQAFMAPIVAEMAGS